MTRWLTINLAPGMMPVLMFHDNEDKAREVYAQMKQNFPTDRVYLCQVIEDAIQDDERP